MLKPGDLDWAAIPRAACAGSIGRNLRGAVRDHIGSHHRRDEATQARGAIDSFDLNYRAKLWAPAAGTRRTGDIGRIVEKVDALIGNEEDLQKGFGIARAGGRQTQIEARPGAFFPMIDRVAEFPKVKLVATTLREVHTTNRARLGRRAVAGRQGSVRPVSWTSSTASAAETASRPASSTA